MYPSKDARELEILLRIGRELDIVGDVSVTVESPSEVLAWAAILADPEIVAWHARDSGHRYLQVSADHHRAPVRGRVTAVLHCEQHTEFWQALDLDRVSPAERRHLSPNALSRAWSVMPITPPDVEPQPQMPSARSTTTDRSRVDRQSDSASDAIGG